MKFYAILLLAAVICYAEADQCTPKTLGVVVKKCIADTKSTEIDFLDVVALKPARSHKAKCFRACMLRDCEFMDSKGNAAANLAKETGKILSNGDPEKASKIEAATDLCLESIKIQNDLCEYTEMHIRCILDDECKDCEITVPNFSL